ncbi:dihydroxyacetone kinase [Pyrenochaeta sp. DS3sAY3a]|nr:dihydroxyacetone kinase [Pyrenochaeta sp. DS3sAY3a]
MVTTFYDDSETPVLEALEALEFLQPGISFDQDQKTVWRSKYDQQHVSLLSGGGAGHEPAHAGFVGVGMLTAAVSGWIFASPSVNQIVSGIARVQSKSGVLLIIKNYTGDMFYFHLAAEKASVKFGIPVEVLVVGDDVAVGRRKSGKVGRRGLAGTVLVHKILGARSLELDASLASLLALGRQVTENLVTVGASLEHVQVPGRAQSTTTRDDHVELGMGIHNETGSQILSPRPRLPHLIKMMLDQLLNQDDGDRSYVDFSNAEEIVLLVNNLGGISKLEIGGITLKSRVLSGTYMTSLNGLGFSISLLKATPIMLRYIDAPTDARDWIKATMPQWDAKERQPAIQQCSNEVEGNISLPGFNDTLGDDKILKAAVKMACKNLLEAEPVITDYDNQVGDGDCGITLARGATAVQARIDLSDDNTGAIQTILRIAEAIESNMDGTSGAVYGIFFTALAAALQSSGKGSTTAEQWSAAAKTALTKLQQATPARQGDRTVMDALEPFILAISEGCDLDKAVSLAREGMEATKGMRPAFGRAVYVEEKAWSLVPDPGAKGVLCIIEGIRDSISL